MIADLPIAPPRNWLADQRAAIRDKVAEAKRFNARQHLRLATVAKAVGAHAFEMDTTNALPTWKRLLRRIAT